MGLVAVVHAYANGSYNGLLLHLASEVDLVCEVTEVLAGDALDALGCDDDGIGGGWGTGGSSPSSSMSSEGS